MGRLAIPPPFPHSMAIDGRVAEWFKAAVLKFVQRHLLLLASVSKHRVTAAKVVFPPPRPLAPIGTRLL
jgi:hypothetical protein